MGSPVLKILLDTHIFLWSLLEPGRLGKGAREVLSQKDLQVWLSPISVWETLLLAEKGRIVLEPDPETWVRSTLKRVSFRDAPLTTEVALVSRSVILSHQDPADRFLAATAAVYGLTLLTADGRLLQGEGYSVLPND